MRGINLPDEDSVAEVDKYCKVPTLLIVSDLDYVTRADMQSQNTSKWVKELRIETMLDCGHWVQLEQPEKLQGLLQNFASEVA